MRKDLINTISNEAKSDKELVKILMIFDEEELYSCLRETGKLEEAMDFKNLDNKKSKGYALRWIRGIINNNLLLEILDSLDDNSGKRILDEIRKTNERYAKDLY